MKTPLKIFLVSVLCLLVGTSSCAQKKKEKKQHRVTHISFNNFSNSPDISKGFWTASKEGEYIYISLLNSGRRNMGSFHINFNVKENELTRTATGFQLDRAAGIMKFDGSFPTDEESGKFTFSRKPEFETFLKGKILSDIEGDKDYYYFKLFLGSIDRDYVNGLESLGYKPTMKQLGKLGIHDLGLDYIKALRKTKYSDLDLDMMIKWAIHGVSVYYVDELAKAGYGDMDANMVKKFAIHNISIDYIKGLARAGYANLDANMVKNFAIHNISIDYINKLDKAGYGNLEAAMLKKFAIHNVSPNYIKSLLSTKINKPDANTLRKAKIHNVTANFIEYARERGHESDELHDYIKWRIRGV